MVEPKHPQNKKLGLRLLGPPEMLCISAAGTYSLRVGFTALRPNQRVDYFRPLRAHAPEMLRISAEGSFFHVGFATKDSAAGAFIVFQ